MTIAKTKFEQADPILNVRDMGIALKYYVEVLGFRNAEWGTDGFTCVSRDTAGIYLCQGGQGTWNVGVDRRRRRGCAL